MARYIIAIDNLFGIEAETEQLAHDKFRRKLSDDELVDPDTVVTKTVDVGYER